MTNRRTFLAATAASASRVVGANDRVRLGLIGSGGRGCYLIRICNEIGAPVSAVCDVYEYHLAEGLKFAPGAKPFDNYKRMLEDKSIDAVIVATPDHAHAHITIDAVEAGKDVFVEKPMANNIEDGFRMVEATRRTRRVVQVGMQRRSNDVFHQAREIVASGALGDVRLVNAWWMNHATSIRSGTLRGKVDWDQWLANAPKRPLDPKRFFGWIYFWDYAGGYLAGQGAHIIDAINMLMGSGYPAAVTASALKPNVEGAEIPETACMTVEYPENFMAVFTVGYKAMRYHNYADQMKQFHGSKARFDVMREAWALYPADPLVRELKPSKELSRPKSFDASTVTHVRNFIDCVRSRKDPNATVEMGNYTNVALWMAIASMRTGRRMRFNRQTNRMEG